MKNKPQAYLSIVLLLTVLYSNSALAWYYIVNDPVCNEGNRYEAVHYAQVVSLPDEDCGCPTNKQHLVHDKLTNYGIDYDMGTLDNDID